MGNERNAGNCQPESPAGGTHGRSSLGCFPSWTFKDILTSSDQFVPTLNPVSSVCSTTALLCTSPLLSSYFCSCISLQNVNEISWNLPDVCCCPVCSACLFSPFLTPFSSILSVYLFGLEGPHSRAQPLLRCLFWSKPDRSRWHHGLML